jgi:hypothetical protein
LRTHGQVRKKLNWLSLYNTNKTIP